MEAKTSLLGIGVNSTDLLGAVDAIEAGILARRGGVACLVPVHNLMASRADERVRRAINSSALSLPDGMGTVWFLRLLGHSAERVYGPDLLLAACRIGDEQGWRHFFLGGTPEVAKDLVAYLKGWLPSMQVAGAYSPPFGEWSDEEQTRMVEVVNRSKADIVWVGLGSPKQEIWMDANRDKLKATWLIGVGAAFDFLSGAKPQAPVWVQRAGMEWLFRLLSEPRRLWRRYANYPWFAVLALGQWLGLKKYPLEAEG